jgi:hypothetical protein
MSHVIVDTYPKVCAAITTVAKKSRETGRGGAKKTQITATVTEAEY